ARLIDVAVEFVHAVDAVGSQIPRSAVGNAMPRRKRIKLPPRIALPAPELESKIMAMLRGLKECARLKGVRLRPRRQFWTRAKLVCASGPKPHIGGLQTSVCYCACHGEEGVRPPLPSAVRN